VLAILAHPDDEIVMAPVLARLAREGGEVALVFATSGDAGPGVSGMEPGAALAALREDEGQCAATALGAGEPIYWRFSDGELGEGARNSQDTIRSLSARISALIAAQKPTTILTWGPDGGYGHIDHRMISNAVTQVVQEEGEDRPELLYAALPTPDETAVGLPGFEDWATLHPSLVTHRLSYADADLASAAAALDCYGSQFDPAIRAALPGLLHQQVWRGTVAFRSAFGEAE
jgi:LmbE family N-acetylglucosaminyl deacetylase